jgi:Flp pilus assembly protein TadD
MVAVALSGCGLFSKPSPRTEEWPAPAEPQKGARGRSIPPSRPGSPAEGDIPERGTPGGPFPAAAPSPLATIDDATPPQVAAATRLANEGRTLLTAGKDDAALESLERAISVDPTNPYAYYFLAELHFRNDSYDQAIAFADRAALLSAHLDGTWLTRSYALQGQALEAAGRVSDAREAYRRALLADRRNQTARTGLDRVDKKLESRP